MKNRIGFQNNSILFSDPPFSFLFRFVLVNRQQHYFGKRLSINLLYLPINPHFGNIKPK